MKTRFGSTEVVSVRGDGALSSLPFHADGPKNACDCDTSVTRGTTTYSTSYSTTYSFTRHVTNDDDAMSVCVPHSRLDEGHEGEKDDAWIHDSFILDDDDEG